MSTTASVRSSTEPTGPYGWPAALVLLALSSLATMVLLWPSALSIAHIWLNSDTYQHGLIIVPLAVFLAWTRRRELAQVVPQPSIWGLVWLAGAGLAWVLARSVDVKLVQHFALVGMLPGLVLTLLGIRVARILIFPLGFVFFAVPFGDFIVPRLQDYTAWFSVQMLMFSGLPVYQDGYYISIPAGDFVVAEVCSGMRYLIASLALGLVYADLSYRSLWRRLALVALAIALPIVANGLRAYGIIMIAHWTDMEHAVGVDHLIYGWFFFGLVMVLLFWLGSLWWEKNPGDDKQTVAFMQVHVPVSRAYLIGVVSVMAMVLAAPRAGDLWLADRAARIAVDAGPRLPAPPPGWDGPVTASGSWQPQYHDANAQTAGAYKLAELTAAVNTFTAGGLAAGEVELHLFHYLNQGDGSEIVSWRNRIYDGRIWRRSSERGRTVARNDSDAMAVHETVLSGPGGTRVVWHWYQVGDHSTTRGVLVKLHEAEALLRGDGRGSLLVAVSAAGGHSADELRSILGRFVADLPLPVDFAARE